MEEALASLPLNLNETYRRRPRHGPPMGGQVNGSARPWAALYVLQGAHGLNAGSSKYQPIISVETIHQQPLYDLSPITTISLSPHVP